MAKPHKVLRWVRLDNASKIYPAVRRKNWSNLFRQSVTLCEDVDVAGALVVSYVVLALPVWFRRPNPVIFVPCDFAAAALYLLLPLRRSS